MNGSGDQLLTAVGVDILELYDVADAVFENGGTMHLSDLMSAPCCMMPGRGDTGKGIFLQSLLLKNLETMMAKGRFVNVLAATYDVDRKEVTTSKWTPCQYSTRIWMASRYERTTRASCVAKAVARFATFSER